MKPTVFNYADHIDALVELKNTNRKNKALELANKRAYSDGFEDCKKADDALIAEIRRGLARVTEERDALNAEHDAFKTDAFSEGWQDCDTCIHQRKIEEDETDTCGTPFCKGCNWEWRGANKEAT